jgi:hypothetical protein
MALTKAEQAKKDIIFASHVLRYGNSYGYNHYVPKGPNGLTGVDELDRVSYGDLTPAGLLYGHGYGYAQTQEVADGVGPHDHIITENVVEDEHADHLTQALEDAKQSFADAVQAARDEFQAMVDMAKMEAADEKAVIDMQLQDGADAAVAAQLAVSTFAKDALSNNNVERQNTFDSNANSSLEPIVDDADLAIEKTEEWINEKIAWVEESILDEYAMKHIVNDLKELKDEALASLNARKEEANAVVADMQSALQDNLDQTETDLCDAADAELGTL